MVPRVAESRFLSVAGTSGLLAIGLLLPGATAQTGAEPGGASAAAPAAHAAPVAPLPSTSPRRPVATYSIVARDPDTGEMGVAVQSHWFSVGPTVPSTNAIVEPAMETQSDHLGSVAGFGQEVEALRGVAASNISFFQATLPAGRPSPLGPLA